MQLNLETRVGIFVLITLIVFAYLGVQIGAFRFDHAQYKTYTLMLSDCSGLSHKADVKIAGVQIGWVDTINLDSESHKALVNLKIKKECALYENSKAMLRQEGMLGPKYIEICVGSPSEKLQSTAIPSQSDQGSIEEVIAQINEITRSLSEITKVIHHTISDPETREQINSLASVAHHIKRMTQTVEDSMIGQIQESIDTFNDTFNKTALKAQESMGWVTTTAQRVCEGEGTVSRLINEDGPYKKITDIVDNVHCYFDRFEKMGLIFDVHFESMIHRAEHYRFPDSKGYFQAYFFPRNDYFYMFQVVLSEKGFIKRKERFNTFLDPCECQSVPINTQELCLNDADRLEFIFAHRNETIKRNSVKFGFQFGKLFDFAALRIGILEGTAGVAVDLQVPLYNEYVSWMTTFEAFDFRGLNRIDDKSPHLKWLNRVWVFNNFYIDFGFDDFVSKCNSSFFLGAGVKFGDQGIQYLMGPRTEAIVSSCN